MYGYAASATKSNEKEEEPPTNAASSSPTNASAPFTTNAPTANATKPSETPAKPIADIDSDHAEVVLPPSALQKVRDVDGVQLIAKRYSVSSSHSIVNVELSQDAIQGAALSKGAEGLRSASETPKKMLVYEVDPQHYRQLVKGLIPIRSSLTKTSYDGSNTEIQRKSVHFSDESGYHLSYVRSFDRPVCNKQTNKQRGNGLRPNRPLCP